MAGKLTARVPLGAMLALGLGLVGAGLLLMRSLEPGSDWTALLPGFVVGGLGIGVISPALAAAMVGVLPVDRAGLASGVNNTFRQLGIAVGIAALGAVFEHRVTASGYRLGSFEGAARIAFVDGLDAIFLIAALAAFAAVPAALLILRLHPFAEP